MCPLKIGLFAVFGRRVSNIFGKNASHYWTDCVSVSRATTFQCLAKSHSMRSEWSATRLHFLGFHLADMDGYTEPLIAVIGHPIAGNPSQFAIERALQSLELDYRVTSFDVQPEQLEAALSGLEVLGFLGVLVDESLASEVGQWWKKRNPELETSAPIHCLFRDPDAEETFAAHDSLSRWIVATCQNHFADATIESILWLGARSDTFPTEIKSSDEMMLSTRTPTVESVEQANLIVIAPGPKKDVQLDAGDWPDNDGSTLVLDLTSGHEELPTVDERGYTTLSIRSRQTGIICQSLHRWTDLVASETVTREAIEEYLGV